MNPAGPARVAILLQRPEAWNNVSRVWELMRDDPSYSATVIALPYNFSSSDPVQRTPAAAKAMLERRGVPFIEWMPGSTTLQAGQYDVAILTAPYDRERPNDLHFDHVASAVRATIYVPYGMPMGAGTKNHWYQYSQPTQCRATAVVARSAAEKALYGRFCPTGNSHVRVLGLPRLDLMQALDDFAVDPDLEKEIGSRVAVLWNSHFSFSPRHAQGTEYSTFDRVGARLLRFACDHPRLALIWRPHPGLFHELISTGACTAAELETLRSELARAGIIIDERPDHRHAFAVSRALMSDLGSFLIEYLVTNRPILYLRNPDGEPPNDEARELLKTYYVAEDHVDVVAFLEMVLRCDDPLAGERQRARAIALPCLDGQASRRVCDLVLELSRQQSATTAQSYPALSRLEVALDAMATVKRTRSPLRRRLVRAYKVSRGGLVEFVKRFPRLLRILDRPH